MSTIHQKMAIIHKRATRNNRPKLNGGPQKKGIILRLRIVTPRKPNSARRPCVKIYLSTKKKALAHIPGAGHTLRRHSKAMVVGTGARDLPVVNYTCMRGQLDFAPLWDKIKRRSIYGVKNTNPKEFIRRKFRKYANVKNKSNKK